MNNLICDSYISLHIYSTEISQSFFPSRLFAEMFSYFSVYFLSDAGVDKIYQIAHVDESILFKEAPRAAHSGDGDLDDDQNGPSVLLYSTVPASELVPIGFELLVLFDLYDQRLVDLGYRFQLEQPCELVDVYSFSPLLKLFLELLDHLFKHLILIIHFLLVCRRQLGQFDDLIHQFNFVFGGPNNSLFASLANILGLHPQIMDLELRLEPRYLLLG